MSEEKDNNETGEETKELTPEEQKRMEMRQAVRFFYDFQKLRIQSSNRSGTDQVALSRGHLDTLAVQAFLLETLEKKALGNVKDLLKEWPIYSTWLKNQKGCGPTMSGVLLSEIDIHRADTPSALWAYCLPPDEPVLILDGVKTMENISVGDHVLDGEGNFAEVKRVLTRKYSGQMITINATNIMPVRCTSDHPVLIARKTANGFMESWVKAIEVDEGDYVVIPRIQVDKNWSEPNLDLAQYIPDNKSHALGTQRLPVNEETARVFGRYVADGSASLYDENGYTRGRCVISFGRGKPLDEYKSIIDRHFKCSTYYVTQENVTHLQFGRTAFAKLFRDEFGSRAHEKRIPHWILTAPDPIAKSFLQGYLEGDGCTVKSGKSSGRQDANTRSETLARQLQMLWARFQGIQLPCLRYDEKQKPSFINGREIAATPRYNLSMTPLKSTSRLRVYPQSDKFYSRVSNVLLERYEGDVYDLTTSSGTFCAGSMVVHNCGLAVIDGHAQRRKKGEKCGYNPWLKSKVVKVLADCMIKAKSPWREFYDNYKTRKQNTLVDVCMACDGKKKVNNAKCSNCKGTGGPAPWGKSDAHRHAAALRYMVKMFLLEFWKEWRQLEGLPIVEPYAEAYLGRKHGDHGGSLQPSI